MTSKQRLALATLFSAAVISSLPACGGGGSATPAASPPAPGQVFGETARACYETPPPVVGDRASTVLEYLGPINGSQKYDGQLVDKDATFEGATGLLQFDGINSGSTNLDFLADGTNKTYSKIISPGVRAQYGGVIKFNDRTPSLGPTRIDTVKTFLNPPAIDEQANLVVGSSLTLIRNSVITSTLIDGTVLPPIPFTQTTTVKFIGRENVTVPAGTFFACKFESTEAGSSDTGTSWIFRAAFIKSSGQSSTGTQVIQLKSATVNGLPFLN